MASTNKTTNYELSQYIGSDKPTYLGDYNGDMLKIDTQMKANETAAATADSKATTAGTNASTALTNAATADGKAVAAGETATSALSKATANETTITEYLTDSEWNTPTLDTSRFKYDSYTRNKYRQIGKLVMVEAVVEPLADINASSNIIDILSGLPAPSYLIQIPTMQVLNNTPIRLSLDTTGKVSAYYNGTLTLLANRAIPLSFMYLVD